MTHNFLYSPYGMVWHTHSVSSLPWYQQTLTGFNGEQTDPATGWQFLGAGHRTYNPGQRYFVSEDPAGDGYAFGSNNPIMNTDPSGNFPKWMGGMMHILRHVGTLGLDHFHKKWANIIGITAVVAIACVAIAASIIAGGEVTPMLATAAGLTFLLRWTCNSISCCSHKQRLKHCQHGCWFLSRIRRYCSNTRCRCF